MVRQKDPGRSIPQLLGLHFSVVKFFCQKNLSNYSEWTNGANYVRVLETSGIVLRKKFHASSTESLIGANSLGQAGFHGDSDPAGPAAGGWVAVDARLAGQSNAKSCATATDSFARCE